MEAAVTGGVAFLLAGVLVPLLARFAVGRDLLDVPNLRSSHQAPTPRLGGLAVICGTWLATLVTLQPDGWPLLVGATLMGAVGLADDLGDLPVSIKGVGQVMVSLGLLYVFPPPLLFRVPGGWWIAALLFGVLWLVAMVNALNFMDGIDGLVGGVAVVNVFFLAALVGGMGGLLTAFVGAVAGFLVWNISPASIFLGDAGSYFMGFLLGTVALYGPVPASERWTPVGFIACALVFTPLLFDTGFTLLSRLRAGKNIFTAHREHIYQQVTSTTEMHRRTSNVYYVASAVAGIAALLVADGGISALAGGAAALVCCGGLLALPRLIGSGK